MFWDFFKRFLFQARSGSLIRRMSWLSVLGIGISSALLVLVNSVMNALNDNVQARTLALEPHLVLSALGSPEAIQQVEVFLKRRGWSFSQLELQDVIFRTSEGRVQGVSGRGLQADGIERLNQDLQRLRLSQPQLGFREVLEFGLQEIWVGADLADILGLLPGDEVSVLSSEALLGSVTDVPAMDRVRVRGILRTGVSDFDASGFYYHSQRSFRRLQKSETKQNTLQVWIQDPMQAEGAKKSLSKALPDLQVQTWKERHSAIFFALAMEKIMIHLFLALSFLIASLSFLSALSLLITERQKEMGILQALGMTRKEVRRLFFYLGFSLAALGLLLGLSLGAGISAWIEKYPIQGVLPAIYYDSRIPARLDFQSLICMGCVALGLASLGAWLLSRPIMGKAVSQLIRSR
ncbi:MAG: FtsX-like permease family protein [Bdellovibrio sp.]